MALVPLVCVGALPTRSGAPSFDFSVSAETPPESTDAPGANVQALLAAGPRRDASSVNTTLARPVAVTTTTTTATARAPTASDVALGARAEPSETSTTVASPSAPTTTAPTTTTVVGVTLTLPAVVTPVAAGLPHLRSERGKASWFHARDGTCAHRNIPLGAVVTVTRIYNGASVTCVVDDRGPADPNRVIDLSFDTFEKLAYPEAGLIEVVVEW